MNVKNTILIVLGFPADSNGNPGPILQSRLDKAIELYRKGLAGKIIVTGAAVDNEFVESEVMAVYCIQHGIPAADIYVESNAKNTYENARMVNKIMLEKGYENAIVVTSGFHKMRAAMFFSGVMTKFKIETAPFPDGFPFLKRLLYIVKEYIIVLLFHLGLLNNRYNIK